jgi:hypothetical protein
MKNLRFGDIDIVIGALDSLGVALADHDHQWSEGEKAIYEESITIMKKLRKGGDAICKDVPTAKEREKSNTSFQSKAASTFNPKGAAHDRDADSELAAEREKVVRLSQQANHAMDKQEQQIQKLRSQLAAELEKRTNLAAFLDGSERKLAELRRTQTTLMDALKLIAWSSEMILPSKVAKEALAKVKEGK